MNTNYAATHTRQIRRRLFGQALLGWFAGAAVAPALAREPIGIESPKTLLTIKDRQRSDGIVVLKLWPLLTENFLRGALLARCDVYKRPLADLEWDMQFQSLIDRDARSMVQLPIFQQHLTKPRELEIRQAWSTWPAQKRKKWTAWIHQPGAMPVINSRRAEAVFDAFEEKDWAVDQRSATVMATPVVLLAQALTELGMRALMDTAIDQVDPSLGLQWRKVKPLAKMTNKDAPWLQSIAQALPTYNDRIFEKFYELADQQFPDRALWLNGGIFSDMPGSKFSKLTASDMDAYKEAAFYFHPRDHVPASFAHYCGN